MAQLGISSIPPSPTLYIKNINDKIGKVELKKTLYELFATYGQIIALVVSKAPKSRGQAFIVFKDIPSATNAMRNLQSYPFFDKPIVIQYAKTKSKATKDIEKWASEHVNEMPYLSALLPEKKSSTATLAAASAVVAEKASLEKEAKEREVSEKVNKVSENQKSEVDSKILDEYTNRILFLENLPVEANETLLSLLFEQYAGFREVRIVPGRPGIAFVEYESENQARIAKDVLNDFKLTPTHAMKVSYAKTH